MVTSSFTSQWDCWKTEAFAYLATPLQQATPFKSGHWTDKVKFDFYSRLEFLLILVSHSVSHFHCLTMIFLSILRYILSQVILQCDHVSKSWYHLLEPFHRGDKSKEIRGKYQIGIFLSSFRINKDSEMWYFISDISVWKTYLIRFRKHFQFDKVHLPLECVPHRSLFKHEMQW